jgi:hypothetical protein
MAKNRYKNFLSVGRFLSVGNSFLQKFFETHVGKILSLLFPRPRPELKKWLGILVYWWLGLETISATPKCFAIADSAARADTSVVHAGASSRPSTRAVETLFWHDLAVYQWLTRVDLQQALLSRWQLVLTEDFSSTLQQPGQALPDRWKDEHTAQLVLSRAPWGEGHWLAGWQWHVGIDSKIFRDDFSRQAIQTRNNDFALSGLYSRLERQLRSNLWVSGQAGYRLEQLLGRDEHGPSFKLNVALAPTLWQGYSHRFDAEGELNELPERRNDDLRVRYSVSRQFENATSDSLFVHFTHLRRDNYFANVGSLDVYVLNRDRRAVENRLDYRLNNGWRFLLHTEFGESRVAVQQHVIERAPDSSSAPGRGSGGVKIQHHDFDARHQADLLWQKANLNSKFSVQFISQAVDYLDDASSSALFLPYAGQGFDSDDWHLRAGHDLRWRMGRRDSLRWYASVGRMAHETGNRNNQDNFDQLTFQANLLYGHRFSPFFSVRWEANAYLEHLVYLKSSHSAGNNWRRVFKLQPSCLFDLAPGFYLKQSFGVLSQYIVYDFPAPLAFGQSNVFRNFFLTDSLFVRFSRRTQAVAQYRLRLEERGQLDWARWQQRPWFDRHEHWASVVLNHELMPDWQVAPGVAYLRQTDWAYRIAPSGFARYRSGGQKIWSPGLTISYIRAAGAAVIFSARRQIVFPTRGGKSSSIDNVRLTVQWSI